MLNLFFAHVSGVNVLIALASGYIVCHLAKKESGALKKIGYIIGAFIIILSSALIIGKILWRSVLATKLTNKAPLNMPVVPSSLPKK